MSTRRAVLRSVLGLAGAGVIGTGSLAALAGCDAIAPGSAEQGAHPLDGFLADTVALGDRYDATMRAAPTLTLALTAIRDAHRAHARALADALGHPAPKPSPSREVVPIERVQALNAITQAEQAARDAAVEAAVTAEPHLAPLVGSIAAARASHLEVLT